MKSSLKELGLKLVEDAALNEEFSAQRGLINELFPYIYEASKRMSSRAISRWLEANGTKLSPATIAKALRNPDPYWQELFEEIEPAARIVANAHNMTIGDLLKDPRLLNVADASMPTIEGVTREGQLHFYGEYKSALDRLYEEWAQLSDTVREACLSSVNLDEATPAEEIQGSKGETA